MKIDTSEWKPFFLYRLYDIRMGNKFDKNKLDEDSPEVNLVSRVSYNNGVDVKVGYVEGVKPFPAGFVTVALGGSYLGSCFVQEEPFYTAQNVAVMKPQKHMTHAVNLFISCLVRYESKVKYYAFGRELNTHIKTDFDVRLPILHNDDGSDFIDETFRYSDDGYVPDWKFMENYICSLHHKPLTTKNKAGQVPKLNIDEWKPFVTARLFPVLENGKANQQMLDEGTECFYVGAKKEDNGVMIHCCCNEGLITKGNCMIFICNGQGSVGYANYMDVDFIGTTDIVAGYNEHLNQYIGNFLATVYSQERPKYSFGRKWKTHLRDTEVKLPIQHNHDGSAVIDEKFRYSNEGYVPDWQFMENYMKALPYGDRLDTVQNL